MTKKIFYILTRLALSIALLGVGRSARAAAPTIAAISDQTVYVDHPALVELMVSDAETPTNLLSLRLTTSNPALIDTNKDVLIRWFADGGPSFMPRWYATVAPKFGQTGTATNTVTVSDGTNTASASFVLTVIAPPTLATRFANTNSITIPTNGIVSPYPMTNLVTGMTGTVSNVVVTISRFWHDNPNDLHMLLVSPSGQGMVIWSKVGGGGPLGGVAPDHAVTNVTATLTDAAPDFAPLPDFYYLWTEQFRPADYAAGNPPTNNFPSPAPAGPYAPTPTSNAFHNAFNGLSPNGTWSLYIYDDQAPYAGGIEGGWSLIVMTTTAQPPTISDIANQSTPTNTPTAALPFTINDIDTPVGSLTLSKASSNPTLVPTNNIVFGGSGSNRTVTITPAAGLSGTSTITITVSDGTNNVSDSFVLTVGTPNTPPSFTAIPNKSVLVGRAAGPFDIFVNDAETPNAITLTATSSNTNLVPNSSIIFYNGPGQRTLTVVPTDGVTGSSVISVTASDGITNTTVNFTFTTAAPDSTTAIFDSPGAISLPLTNIAVPYPSTISVTNMPGFISNVTVTLKGLSHSQVTNLEMLLEGPSGQTVVLMAKISGGASTNITVTLDDTAAYPLPPLGFQMLPGTYRPRDGGYGIFPAPAPGGAHFNVLSAYNGASPNGQWRLYIHDNLTGSGTGTIAHGWSLAIKTDVTNTPPSISAVSNVATLVNTATAAIPFTVFDGQTAASNLMYAAISQNTNLVPVSNIVFGGSGTNRTVSLTPSSNVLGTATIQLLVNDGVLSATNTFVLTVNPAPLTVTASNLSRMYGLTNPVLTGSIVGLQAGDIITPIFSTTATTNSPLGGYPTTFTLSDPGNKLGNYVITTNNGTLTVTNALLTVSANSSNKIYGATRILAGTEFTITSGTLFNGDTLTNVALTCAGTNVTAPVGSYVITASGALGAGLTNYAIGYSNGTLTVNAASLLITANNASKAQGAALTFIGNEFSASGLLNGDTVMSASLSSIGAVPGAVAGSYPITVTNATGSGLSNYFIAYVAGTLTVTNAGALFEITSITVSGGVATITWNSVSNQSYVLQYKNDLTATNWSDVPVTIVATNTSASTTNVLGGTAQRFYRVRLGTAAAVVPAPQILTLVPAGNNVVATWTSVAGHFYRLQYNDNLTTTNWTDVLPEVTAAGPTASATNSVAGVAQRYFRVWLRE